MLRDTLPRRITFRHRRLKYTGVATRLSDNNILTVLFRLDRCPFSLRVTYHLTERDGEYFVAPTGEDPLLDGRYSESQVPYDFAAQFSKFNREFNLIITNVEKND